MILSSLVLLLHRWPTQCVGWFDHNKEIHVQCVSVDMIVTAADVLLLWFVYYVQHSIMASCFVGMYLASNFNCLQSASNVVLDVNVQEVLPAVQTSYVRMTSRKWWAMVTVP